MGCCGGGKNIKHYEKDNMDGTPGLSSYLFFGVFIVILAAAIYFFRI